MVLIICAVTLVFAITTYQALFGMYSGLINVMCSVIAVAVSLGFYEPVAALAGNYIPLSYAEASSVLLLFVLTLGLLRGVADIKIRGNVTFPKMVDTAGGAVCGFVNAQFAVGILLISFFLLPLGPSRLGFERWMRLDPDEQGYVKFKRRSVSFLKPDEFTVGTFNLLSNGALNGGSAMAVVYPDYIEWLAATANTPQVQTSPTLVRAVDKGYKQGLKVESYWVQTEPVSAYYLEQDPSYEHPERKYGEPKPYRPMPGTQLVGVRIALTPDSADQEGKTKQHTFRPTMIRLVGKVAGKTVDYYPRILAGADGGNYGLPRVVNYDDSYGPEGSSSLTVDAYFEVDPAFKPWFVEYRRRARGQVKSDEIVETAPEPLDPLETRELRNKLRDVRNNGFVGTINRAMTKASTDMPFKIMHSQIAGNTETRGSDLLYGRISGFEDDMRSGSGDRVRSFNVPKDHSVVQIRYSPRAAQSLPGQVMSFAGQLASYLAVDDKGNKYRLNGYYLTVKRKGKDYYDLYYAGFDNPEAQTYNASIKFGAGTISRQELLSAPAEGEICLLFIVPNGTLINRIETSAGKGVDLESASVQAN